MGSILLFLAVIPVVIICTYIYLKDRNKEPWSLLIKLFVLGIASCFLVLMISGVLFEIFPFMNKDTAYMTFFEVMAYAFVGVAFIEELCKWIMVYVGSYFNKAYDELYDGIVYSVYVSLGFAFLENLLYVFKNQSIVVGISRGLLAVPGHACDAVFMGYYLSLAKVYASQGKKSLEKKNLVLSVLVPTILHGIYDFCLFANVGILLLVFLGFVILLYIFSIKKIKLLSAQCKQAPRPVQQQPQYQQQYQQQYAGAPVQNQQTGYVNYKPQLVNGYCPNCGTPTNAQFCPNCGYRQN